jgi:hypothetical protein
VFRGIKPAIHTWKEVTDIERSKGLILLTIVAMATILGGVALTTAGASNSGDTNELTTLVADTGDENTIEPTSVVVETEENSIQLLTVEDGTEETTDSGEPMHWEMMPIFGPRQGPHGGRGFGRGFGFEVSEEFEENVLTIAEGDEDVQALLDDGYNVTGVRPIIKTVVDGEGNVVTKATDAIVMLEKEDTGRAGVWVNLDEAKVTEIVILTRTVIEK